MVSNAPCCVHRGSVHYRIKTSRTISPATFFLPPPLNSQHGVFEEAFMFDHLGQLMKSAATNQERYVVGSMQVTMRVCSLQLCMHPSCREELSKIQAKLSNPLLRQPAPFEY